MKRIPASPIKHLKEDFPIQGQKEPGRRPFKALCWLLCTLLLPSCSVLMAFNPKGADTESIQQVLTREDLLALGAIPVSSETLETGELIETFQIVKKKTDGKARGFVYSLLDLGSFFLWEFIGTPIEAALQEKNPYLIQVTFDAEEHVQKVEAMAPR